MIDIEVYAPCWNEQTLLPLFLDHYKGCDITIYDNGSTDLSVSIAKDSGAKVIPFETGGFNSESQKTVLKNNCWKGSKADAVIIVDIDELVDYKNFSGTIARCKGYDMLGLSGLGIPSVGYNKFAMFDPKQLIEINYSHGCHKAKPIGNLEPCEIDLYHYKYISFEYVVKRHRELWGRQNAENLKNGWDIHYSYPEEKLNEYYTKLKTECQKVR